MKYIITVIVLFLGWCLFWNLPINGFHYETGTGSQVGFVSAVEKNGLFWKTGRVFIKPTLESTQEDVYCVSNQEVYSKLEVFSREKTNVKVSHVTYFANGLKNCNGGESVVFNVEER